MSRPATEAAPKLEQLNKEQLFAKAEELGLKLAKKTTKPALIEAIVAKEAESKPAVKSAKPRKGEY